MHTITEQMLGLQRLSRALGDNVTEEQLVVIDTARTILSIRILSENDTEALASQICLRALEILLDLSSDHHTQI